MYPSPMNRTGRWKPMYVVGGVILGVAAFFLSISRAELESGTQADETTGLGQQQLTPIKAEPTNIVQVIEKMVNVTERVELVGTSVFDKTLREYVKFHNDMVSANSSSPPRFILYRCGEPHRTWRCAGLGDRIKGIINVFVMALYLKRAFLLESTIVYDLGDVYDQSVLDWRLRTVKANGRVDFTKRVKRLEQVCFLRAADCMLSRLSEFEKSDADVIIMESNMDLSGAMVRSRQLAPRMVELGVFDDSRWRSKIVTLLMTPNEEVRQAIARILPKKNVNNALTRYPEIVMHIRTGGTFTIQGKKYSNSLQPNDNPQSILAIETNVDRYTKCLQQIVNAEKLLNTPTMETMFLASDNAFIFDLMENSTSKIKGPQNKFLTGDLAGELGHVKRDVNGTDEARHRFVRLAAEFEIMRNAKYLLAGESGLSLMAFKTRARYDMNVYAAWNKCEWPWSIYHVDEGDRR